MLPDDICLAEIRERQLNRKSSKWDSHGRSMIRDIDYLLSLLAAPPPQEAATVCSKCKRQRLNSTFVVGSFLCRYCFSTEFDEEKNTSGEALRSPFLAQERDSWQPISTAPKDGTEILVFEQEWYVSGNQEDVIYCKRMVTAYYVDKGQWDHGWREKRDDDHRVSSGWYLRPTHWMQLPPPPGSPLPTNEGEK